MNVQFQLEDTPAARLEKLRRLASAISLPPSRTTTGIPRTPTERANNITVVRDWYLPGYLPRYTLDDGSGSTPVTAAWNSMLQSGAGLCIVPRPVTAWLIDDTITWQPGVDVLGARGNLIWSDVASGEDTFVFEDITYNDGAGFSGFALRTLNDGANGIKISESGNVQIDHFSIRHLDSGTGGIGIYLDGGTDGNHHNEIGHNGFIYDYATGIKMYTTGGAAANCNRNRIGQVHINNCTVGMDLDRTSTNHIECSVQANDTGLLMGAACDKNIFDVMLENNSVQIDINAGANNNVFRGSTSLADFNIDPHISTIVISSNDFMFPRDVNMVAGNIRLLNPLDAGPMRIGAWEAGQSLRFGQRLNSGVNEDIAELLYHATDPVFKFHRPARLATYTVGTLPANPVQGDTAFVTDANAPVFGAAVAAGGAVRVPVYYTGAAWFVG